MSKGNGKTSAKKPVVFIDQRTYNLMSYWAYLGGQRSQEITCFGLCEIKNGHIIIDGAYLIDQEGTSGGVDGDDEAIVALTMELDAKGVSADKIRCWVHSHPGTGEGATYLSGIDEANIDRWLNGDFLVSIVFDSAGQSPYCRLDLKNPRLSVEADLKAIFLNEEDAKWAKEEFDKKVRKAVSANRWDYMNEYYEGYYSGEKRPSYSSSGTVYKNGKPGYRDSKGEFHPYKSSYKGYSYKDKKDDEKEKSSGKARGRSAWFMQGWPDNDAKKDAEKGKAKPLSATKTWKKLAEIAAGKEDDDEKEKTKEEEKTAVPEKVEIDDTDQILIDLPEGFELDDADIEIVDSIRELEAHLSTLIDEIAEKVQMGHLTDLEYAVQEIAKLGISEHQAWLELQERITQ